MEQKQKLISMLTNFLDDGTKHSLPPAKGWIAEFADYLMQNEVVVLPKYQYLTDLQQAIIREVVDDMDRHNRPYMKEDVYGK